jgi:uncharacterized membrane protein YdjX (TVP38/TMEM64 family)
MIHAVEAIVIDPCARCCLHLTTGITQVRFLDYAWASWLGMLPGTFAYVYLGSLGKVAADAAGDGSSGADSTGALKLVLYGELPLQLPNLVTE